MADRIVMEFPGDTEYTSAVRLALSGIAGRLDYGMDDIEDIRSCVSEACILILNGQKCERLNFEILAGQEELRITVAAAGISPDNGEQFEDFSEEVSRIMIEALSDECAFVEDDGMLSQISFAKKRNEHSERVQ